MIDDLDPPKLVKPDADTSLQDGMLSYYLAQSPLQDSQVETRVEKEPFFLLELMQKQKWRKDKYQPKTVKKP